MRRLFSLILVIMLCMGTTAHAAIWFGEENGHTLHRDPFCRNRSLNMPNPFEHTFDYENTQAVIASGEWLACTNCYTDSFANPKETFSESFSDIWNASLEEKAAMLPGVWTLPSEQAISPEEAYQTAKAYLYFKFACLSNIISEFFPFRYPTNADTLKCGGILTSMCM